MRPRVEYPRWVLVLFALYFLQEGLIGGIWLMGGVSWYDGLSLGLRFIPVYELAGSLALVYVANRYRHFIAPHGTEN